MVYVVCIVLVVIVPLMSSVCFFFFKQKTAYEMRISDWSSDVCSSDLTSPVPGMSADDFARLKMPVLIHRNGVSDLSHTRRTSDWVHELIPGDRKSTRLNSSH